MNVGVIVLIREKKNSGECITVRRLLWTGIKAHTLQSQNQIRWISMICKWLLSSWLHRNSFCVRMQNHFFLLLTLQRNRNNSFVFFFHFFFYSIPKKSNNENSLKLIILITKQHLNACTKHVEPHNVEATHTHTLGPNVTFQ